MRKTLFLLLLSVLFISCSKKNNVSPKTSVTIVGKWYVKSDTIRAYKNNVLQSISGATDFISSDFVQFNNDGTGLISSYTTDSLTYSISNNRLTENVGATKTVNVSYPAYTTVLTVKQLTANSLILYFDVYTTVNSVTEDDNYITYYSKTE